MKLRIRENTIRFRLSKSEVESFKDKGSINCVLDFGLKQLNYSLVRSKVDKAQASYFDNQISIFLPEEVANHWTDTDEVSIQDTIEIKHGVRLQILIEKDFQCLTHRGPEDEDTFPNPNAVEFL